MDYILGPAPHGARADRPRTGQRREVEASSVITYKVQCATCLATFRARDLHSHNRWCEECRRVRCNARNAASRQRVRARDPEAFAAKGAARKRRLREADPERARMLKAASERRRRRRVRLRVVREAAQLAARYSADHPGDGAAPPARPDNIATTEG